MFTSFLTLPKNIYLLFLSQIIGMSATALIALTGGIIGAELAPSRELSTLPITSLVIGLAIAIIPSAMLMKKIGRKKGFLLSCGTAIFASLFAAYALSIHNFYLFCFAILLIGTNGAFVQQYRFAAIESVESHIASKAASLVLFAGVFSGFLGPEIAKHTKFFFLPTQHAGSFLILAFLYGIAATLLTQIKDPASHMQITGHSNRPLLSIIKNPRFLIAVLAGSIGFGTMSFIMTATPIHLHTITHHTLDQTAFVIQSHIIAMFLPSLVTGILVEKFGVFKVLIAGLISFLFVILIGTQATTIPLYWMGLVLLGVGWNFLFISATMLLSQSYTNTERFKAQGVNDFIVILTQLSATFLAGKFLFSVGWIQLHLLTIPLILLALFIFVINRKNILLHKKNHMT